MTRMTLREVAVRLAIILAALAAAAVPAPSSAQNAAPSAPVPLLPSDSSRFDDDAPTLRFEATDPEGDDLEYHVQWSTDLTFATADERQSSVDPGFENTEDPVDASPFTPGQSIAFTIDPPLLPDATYWWRVRARDPTGSESFGPWSTPRSLTHSPGVVPPPLTDWHQTTNEQFETGTLANAIAIADAVIIQNEGANGTLTTPDISLADLTLDPAITFTEWRQVRVNVTHPDPVTTVEVRVFDTADVLIAGPVVDAGDGTGDVLMDLAGATAQAIYVEIRMTPGSTPQVNDITAEGDAPAVLPVPALGPLARVLLVIALAGALFVAGPSCVARWSS